MEISAFTLRLIILLLPGGLAALLVELLTAHKKWSAFQFVLYSVFLGGASYFAHQIYFYLKAAVWPFIIKQPVDARVLTVWPALIDGNKSLNPLEIIVTCLVAVFIGFAVTGMIQHKILFRLAKLMRVSRKYGDESLYEYFLNQSEVQWVWVRSKARGLTYRGWVEIVSDQELVLNNVTVYTYDTSEKCYEVPRLYMSLKEGDIVIEVPETPQIKEKEEEN